MPLSLPRLGLCYHPIPKVACTSLKKAFYRLENGHDFPGGDIHAEYHRTEPLAVFDDQTPDALLRIAVVRDPIARLVSAYNNRVMGHRELAPDRIDLDLARRLFLVPDPDPDFFFLNIDRYRTLSFDIRHHTEPMTSFLGPSLRAFDRVFVFEELDRLADWLARRVGTPVRFVHEQVSEPGGPRFERLSPAAQAAAVAACWGDYALVADLYAPPAPRYGRRKAMSLYP
jgi:hypothetical protein